MINRLLDKNQYAKPFLVVEEFMAHEYYSACPEERIQGWRAYGNMIISNKMYHDLNNNGQHYHWDNWGIVPYPVTETDEDVEPAGGEYPPGASADNNICSTDTPPANLNNNLSGYYWYSNYNTISNYTNNFKITTPIYQVGNQYFNNIEPIDRTVKNRS